MWQILVLLIVGSCYSSAEEVYNVTIVEIPAEVPDFPIERPASTGNPDTRIIGGTPATIESYPYTVQVLSNNQLVCGGSLLTRRHVLSAAHCFVDSQGFPVSPSPFRIRAGTADLNTGGSSRSVSRIINHERYNVGLARDNDISIVLLSGPIRLRDQVALALIPSQGSSMPDNAAVVVVGWGRTNVNVNNVSPVLNHVTVYTINHFTCSVRYRQLESIKNEHFPVTDNMMCTGILDIGGRDACQGDGGGPVIYAGIVVGVTSWGEGCAHEFYPRVNARVSAYTNWITTTIAQNSAFSLSPTIACLLLVSLLVSSVFSNKL